MKNEVDIHIGKKIREIRSNLGITLKVLGNIVGVTYQQMQKYEIADNKVSACRLYLIAKSLNVPIEYFFRNIKLKDRLVSLKLTRPAKKTKTPKVKKT